MKRVKNQTTASSNSHNPKENPPKWRHQVKKRKLIRPENSEELGRGRTSEGMRTSKGMKTSEGMRTSEVDPHRHGFVLISSITRMVEKLSNS